MGIREKFGRFRPLATDEEMAEAFERNGDQDNAQWLRKRIEDKAKAKAENEDSAALRSEVSARAYLAGKLSTGSMFVDPKTGLSSNSYFVPPTQSTEPDSSHGR